jgi:hypothetical protein
MGSGSFFSGRQSGLGVKLATHLHLLPRLLMQLYLHSTIRFRGMVFCLVKHRKNITFTLPYIIWVIKSRRLRTTGYVAVM